MVNKSFGGASGPPGLQKGTAMRPDLLSTCDSAPDQIASLETSLLELLRSLQDAGADDEEAVAVLQALLLRRRIYFCDPLRAEAA